MTGTLVVVLRAKDSTLHGAPVRIRVTATGGRVARAELVLVGGERTLTLAPGPYTVQAVLPSGLVLDSELTTVTHRPARCTIDLDELTPASWLTASAVLSPSITHEYKDYRHGAYATSWARLWAARGPSWHPAIWPDPHIDREPTGLRLTFNALARIPHMIQTGVGTGPWTLTSLPLHDQVHVTVRPVWPDGPGLHVSCLTPEAGAHALLGYSSTGAVSDALAVAQYLADARSSPTIRPHVLAAALGHHLPALKRSLRTSLLRDILVSTAGTVDGAVIAAWNALEDMRQNGAEQSADTVCQLFLRATALGMPTCTLGLRHLLDALRSLARTPSAHQKAARKALSACAAFMTAADPRNPFLTFDGVRPDAPGHAGTYMHERPDDAVPLVAEDWTATLGWPAPRHQGRQRSLPGTPPTEDVSSAEPRTALEVEDPVRSHFKHGMSMLATGSYEEAIADFTSVLDADPSHALALASRAAAYRLIGANDEAIRDATQATELDPELAWAYATRGAIHRLEKRYAEALADLDRAIELQADYDWCIAGRGETYRLMGKTDLALEDLNQALAINPDNDWALMRRAAVYMDDQQDQLSLSAFGEAANAYPDGDWALIRPDQTYRRIGKDLTHYVHPMPAEACDSPRHPHDP
ncbi:tetratricopeptide repeat protein [Streptomyces gilvifuscus]|uniref:Tetratricopeptide repeat protein n=1 Tax=Streptomyces gilvifuscus TaxID=1550617 RepID=A0ABT5G6I0_9ACTN|nr:tetratricopeptide repeat protein [Streptomyces gilvifuscus]MDC2960395.1 tetratricopeptide repeat protein [Streptomyces gilvifuscus]